MKTNLHKSFKTDSDHEDGGIWMMTSEETGFLVRRFGGANEHRLKQAMAKHYKPYARLIQNDSLPAKKENEIITKIFVDACLVDWKGVEIDGVKTEFSKEKAIELLIELPELRTSLQEYAAETKNFREDLGEF
jgi:uncharacterized coiled-coil DUF342 family protein